MTSTPVDTRSSSGFRRRSDLVLAQARALVDELPVGERVRGLLQLPLDVGAEQLSRAPVLPAVQLPILVHAALCGEEEPAVGLAVASLLVYLGADVLDNVADDELPATWADAGPHTANLVGATYLAALVPLAVERACGGGPDGRTLRLLLAVPRALLAMSAGQAADLAQVGTGTGSSLACVDGKSGAELALFARMGALLACDDARVADRYAQVGRDIGTAGQLASDIADLVDPAGSRDLATGKRTLPIAHALDRATGRGRAGLEELLRAARSDPQARAAVGSTLAELGSFVYAAVVVEKHRQAALSGLVALRPRTPAAEDLFDLVHGLSPFPGAGRGAHR